MLVCILVDRTRYVRWHTWLLADLAGAGHSVEIVAAHSSLSFPVGLVCALRLDRFLHRHRGGHSMDAVSPQHPLPEHALSQYDVIIDCSGSPDALAPGLRSLTPMFNGVNSELGAIAAALDDKVVEITLVDECNTEVGLVARPAFPNRYSLNDQLDAVLSRAVELIVECIARPDATANRRKPSRALLKPEVAGHAVIASAYRKLAGSLATKWGRQLRRPSASRSQSRWALAIRPTKGTGICESNWPSQALFRIVPDDGRRFYADPLLIEHNGRTWLFCEEFTLATERGIISVAEVFADGSVGAMRPVLKRPYHLSYPFIFFDGGQHWMIPESAESGAVELYRATEFPYSWIFEKKMIDGITAYDATHLTHGDRSFLLLTTKHRFSTSWDNLRIYEADSLDCPFVPHSTGLSLIDRSQSRAGGAILRRGTDLIRPVQDCSKIYGGGLILARIDQLTSDVYRQTPIAQVRVIGNAAITGIHTYTHTSQFEAVDVWGSPEGITEVTIAVQPTDAATS